MNFADILVIAVVLLILGIIVYLTRPKNKDSQCGGCRSDCSSCSAFSDFYEDYKKDHHKDSAQRPE